MSGWIKLHRDIQEHWIYPDREFTKYEAWIDLLMMVNHKDSKTMIGKEIVEVKRGQKITSIRKLCSRWGWSNTKVKTFLKLLEDDGMIKVKSDTKKTLITVVNYGVYQDNDMQKTTGGRQKNDGETTQKHTNKNDKNVKNDKEEVVVAADNPFRFFEENGFGTLSPFLVDEINHWIDGDYFDEPEKIIIEALKESLRANVRRWIYANKILMEWSNQKLRTLNDVKAHIKARNNVVPLKEKSSYEKMQEAARAEWAKTDKLMAELRAEIRRRQRLQQANGG